MPYATNRGVRIHYRVEGAGSPLVLQHGFTESGEDWYECGYVEALRPGHRLILVDARGHGASEKPHEADAYTLDQRVGDVVAVLDVLNIARADFWGYSMGGWIGFGIARYAPERVCALVVGGQHPYARNLESLREVVRSGIAGGSQAFVVALERLFGFTATPEYKARLAAADLEALLALAQDRSSLQDLLPTMAMPCCLYAGEADPIYSEAKAASRLIPQGQFVSLPGLTHCGAFTRIDLVLPLVTAFLKDASASRQCD